jgi:lipopolysaccharide export system permease protein
VFGLLHRSFFYELTKVFLLAFVGLTALLLLAGVVDQAIRNGLGPTQILAAIPLLVPGTVPYTLPTTTLFATCIIYGRAAADNEILAMRAAGVHIRHAILPALALGTLASAITFVLFLDLIPYTHFLLRSQVTGDVRELMFSMLKRESCIRHPRLNYEIYVARVDGQKLKDAEFRKKDGKGGYEMIAVAKEAEFLVDLKNHKIHFLLKQCYILDGKGMVTGFFQQHVLPFEIPEELAPQGKMRPSDMTWSELFTERAKTEDDREKLKNEIAAHITALNLHEVPPPDEAKYPAHIHNRTEELKVQTLKLAGLDAEIYQRPAFALGCLCFVVVGCPVAIWFSKSDFLSAFITCFLPIVIIYYPLMLCGINLVRSGKVDPWTGIGAADGLMFVAASIMYLKLARA